MTKEERAIQWSRGIPEMEEMSLEEKKKICHEVALQLLILSAGATLIMIFIYSWMALTNPGIMEHTSRMAEMVNQNFEHHHTRALRMEAVLVSMFGMLPEIFMILVPILGPVVLFRKPLLRKAAVKLSRQWRMETDIKVEKGVTAEDVTRGINLLEKDEAQYVILTPPDSIDGVLFIQSAHEKGNHFTLEISRKEDGGSRLYGLEHQTKEQVAYVLQNYLRRQIVPDTGTWEDLGFFGGSAVQESVGSQGMLDSIYWMFTNERYTSQADFSRDVMEYMEENKGRWKPEDIAVQKGKVYVIYEAFISGREELLKNESVVDESTLEEECRIDGLFQTDICALLTADNGSSFTNGELLMKVHNQMAEKDMGDHDFFEGLTGIEPVGGIPAWYVHLGS